MKAAVLHGPGDIRVESREVPALSQSGMVLLRSHAAWASAAATNTTLSTVTAQRLCLTGLCILAMKWRLKLPRSQTM